MTQAPTTLHVMPDAMKTQPCGHPSRGNTNHV